MSGSPKTVKRLPAPVFLSSSPMSRSAFIRTISTGMRPSLRTPATLAKPSSEASTVTPSSSVTPVTCGSKAKPRIASRSTSSASIASRAAFFTNDGLTVPYCGPIAIAIRVGASPCAPRRRAPRSPGCTRPRRSRTPRRRSAPACGRSGCRPSRGCRGSTARSSARRRPSRPRSRTSDSGLHRRTRASDADSATRP